MLDLAIKNADLITSVFGPGKKVGVPGHQEIEIGLVKLYRITGDQKYLDLAKHFLDQRGKEEGRELFGQYSQDHIPILEQDEAVGHAVRAAYAETCAAIANAFWNHRMFLLHGDAKYIDVLEKVIYNGMLSGVALSGDLFFYPNPLESFGQHERSSWFNCACCPSNIPRFMPSIPGYVYAQRGKALYINLFVDSEAEIVMNNNKISIFQETKYPWEGKVRIRIKPEFEKKFTVHVRIPGWALEQPVPSDLYHFIDKIDKVPTLMVNGKTIPLNINKGYVLIQRRWKEGDTIELNLPMPVRRVESHPEVKENTGKIALVRGPVVYCAEWPDNGGHVSHLVLSDDAELLTEMRDDLLNGVTVIKGQAFMAIPYYAWAHRGPGEMAVWLSREEGTARPLKNEK